MKVLPRNCHAFAPISALCHIRTGLAGAPDGVGAFAVARKHRRAAP